VSLFLGQFTVLVIHLQFLCINGGKEFDGKISKVDKWSYLYLTLSVSVCNGLENCKANKETI
jgi:hypothetical protein